MRHLIFQQLLRFCARYPVPDLWRRFEDAGDCYRPPCDGAAAVAQLVDMFGELALLAAGVVNNTADGLMLSPPLADPDGVLIALRESLDVPPHDLMTAARLLGSETPSILAYLAVPQHAALAKSDNRVFIAFTIDDVVVLHSVRLAAAMAGASAACSPQDWLQLCRQVAGNAKIEASTVDLANPAEPPLQDHAQPEPELNAAMDGGSSSEEPPDDPPAPSVSQTALPRDLSIVLVNCSLAALTCSTPTELPALASLLAEAEQYLGYDLSSISVWRPSSDAIAKLRFLSAHGDQDSVRAAILESVTESTRALDGFSRPGPCEELPHDLAAAAAAVSRLIREDPPQAGYADRYRIALRNLFERVEQDVVMPLAGSAIESTDPVRRSRLLVLSDLYRQLNLQNPLVQREVIAAGIVQIGAGKHSALQNYLKTMDRFSALAAALTRSR